MKTLLKAAMVLMLAPSTVGAQINAGELKAEPELPFTMTKVADFRTLACRGTKDVVVERAEQQTL